MSFVGDLEGNNQGYGRNRESISRGQDGGGGRGYLLGRKIPFSLHAY